MPTIRQLSTSLVNQIAAGEVIERPASVVKEMLENSIDSGATRVEVAIEKGGSELIRIVDNGCGIAIDELPLAVAPHATSKLQTAADLFAIRSLGFRGEALASIAEVSHLELRSRPAEQAGGGRLSVRGGVLDGPHPCAAPVGTSIEIRHLFFNTPVRGKFLKSPSTEMGHISEAFTRVALANPEVAMTLISGNRTVQELAATPCWSERIRGLFDSEIGQSLIAVDSGPGSIRIQGYVVDPQVSRSNNRQQYLLLNGRFIRDRSLQHALSEAYRGLIMVGRFPVAFLRIDLPPDQVDVNVHPTKMEVRFVDGSAVYSRLLQTIRHRFLSTDLTARGSLAGAALGAPGGGTAASANLQPSPAEAAPESPQEHRSGHRPAELSARPVDPLAAHTQELMNWARTGQNNQSASPTRLPNAPAHNTVPGFKPFPAANHPIGLGSIDPPQQPLGSSSIPSETAASPLPVPDSSTADAAVHPTPSEPSLEELITVAGRRGMQIHDSYLVTQNPAGMFLIDQHALHERVLYEQIRQRVLSGQLETQRLLVPEPVTLSPAEVAIALDAQDLLREVGIHLEPFGGDTLLVTAYPAMLANMSPADVLREMLDNLVTSGRQPDRRQLLDELLHSIACKAAVKAGDRLKPDEIDSLLEQRHHFQDSHHCPHGRPTALFFSRQELDRMFKRT
jgi:DNA mismatch repair protein MutL